MTVQLPLISCAVILEPWTSVILKGVGLNAGVYLLAFVCFTMTLSPIWNVCGRSPFLILSLYCWSRVRSKMWSFGVISDSTVRISLPPFIAACGLTPVAQCGVDRYICRNLWDASLRELPSRVAACRASFMLRLSRSTVPFALGHSGVMW